MAFWPAMDRDGSVLWAVVAQAEAAGEGKGADVEANEEQWSPRRVNELGLNYLV